jgi:amino acid transporter
MDKSQETESSPEANGSQNIPGEREPSPRAGSDLAPNARSQVRASSRGDGERETVEPSPPRSNPPLQPGTTKIKSDLRQEEVHKGSHPGDTFIRYRRQSGPFRRLGRNVLAASIETEAPRTAWGRLFGSFKRVVIGRPLSTEQSMHERLTNVKALAVLSSDALSSVAYATEEILKVLVVGGAALWLGLPIAFAVILLMAIVVTSYRQTIAAYPRGGGTYIVAKDNLGTLPGLAAASSILIGYILTVAVSVAAGVAALYSIFPALKERRVEVCIALIVFITIANLRGLREAGNIFAVPTYLFILGILGMIIFGVFRLVTDPTLVSSFVGAPDPIAPPPGTAEPIGLVLMLVLLRAFTQGSAALTGVEAIADGVPAFKPPEAENARKTLFLMGAISIVMFGGITWLATSLNVHPSEHETVVSQIARNILPPIFGAHPLWFFIQIVTALILVLAANTAFSDFPRLSYFLARDKFMPHQYAFRGDKLAFSWGIVTLAVLACVLVVIFKGDTSALIPLYAIGVMGAFTFSQGGMVARWWRKRPAGWRGGLVLNGVGALVTLIVFLVATLTKLNEGTWLVIVLIPIMMALFLAVNRHYERVKREIAAADEAAPETFKHTFIVPVASLSGIALRALSYARSLSANVTAVHIVESEESEEAEDFNRQWNERLPGTDIQLVIIDSPYRSLIGPLLAYIDALDQQQPDDTITVILPEVIPAKPWEYLLHNQSALRLKARLLFRPNTVVADIPHLLGRGSGAKQITFPWFGLITLLVIAFLAYIIFF